MVRSGGVFVLCFLPSRRAGGEGKELLCAEAASETQGPLFLRGRAEWAGASARAGDPIPLPVRERHTRVPLPHGPRRAARIPHPTMPLWGARGGAASSSSPSPMLRRPPSAGDELDRLLTTGKAAPTSGWATAKVRVWVGVKRVVVGRAQMRSTQGRRKTRKRARTRARQTSTHPIFFFPITSHAQLNIEGMHCASCSAAVEAALK
jgi:hypothetical protein